MIIKREHQIALNLSDKTACQEWASLEVWNGLLQSAHTAYLAGLAADHMLP